jgi:hypothetical protein
MGNGLPLHSHVMDGARWVQIVNGNPCDVRRENLGPMTKKEVGAVMRARKAVDKQRRATKCERPINSRAAEHTAAEAASDR